MIVKDLEFWQLLVHQLLGLVTKKAVSFSLQHFTVELCRFVNISDVVLSLSFFVPDHRKACQRCGKMVSVGVLSEKIFNATEQSSRYFMYDTRVGQFCRRRSTAGCRQQSRADMTQKFTPFDFSKKKPRSFSGGC